MEPIVEQSIEQRLRNAGPGLNVGVWLFLIGVFDIAVVLTVAWFVAPQAAIPAIVLVLLLPPTVIGLILRLTWLPMARKFPAKPQTPNAIVKKSQSIAFGWFGRYNQCAHVAADEHHLHLIPPAAFRVLGARVMSLPWDAMREVKPSVWPGMTRAKINGRSITAPNWCMKLASATDPSG